jgi:hypothetical protein
MVKYSKLLVGLGLAAGLSVSGLALADHFRGHVGVYLGVPFPYYPYYAPYYTPYPPYYPYYPPAAVVPPQPQAYVEQSPARAAPGQQAGGYWYHCDKPEGYYPYVKSCPGGWQAVVPSPPPQ